MCSLHIYVFSRLIVRLPPPAAPRAGGRAGPAGRGRQRAGRGPSDRPERRQRGRLLDRRGRRGGHARPAALPPAQAGALDARLGRHPALVHRPHGPGPAGAVAGAAALLRTHRLAQRGRGAGLDGGGGAQRRGRALPVRAGAPRPEPAAPATGRAAGHAAIGPGGAAAAPGPGAGRAGPADGLRARPVAGRRPPGRRLALADAAAVVARAAPAPRAAPRRRRRPGPGGGRRRPGAAQAPAAPGLAGPGRRPPGPVAEGGALRLVGAAVLAVACAAPALRLGDGGLRRGPCGGGARLLSGMRRPCPLLPWLQALCALWCLLLAPPLAAQGVESALSPGPLVQAHARSGVALLIALQ